MEGIKQDTVIKMVVTDLDDTLLRTDKSISRYTVDTLQKIRCGGTKVIFATARGKSSELLVPYEMFDGYVLYNGAKAYIDNQVVYEREIPAEVHIPFLKLLSENNLKVAAEINGIHYSNFNVKNKWDYIGNFIITDYIDGTGGADKLFAIIENTDQIDIIKSNLPDGLYLKVSRDGLAMIMHKDATKSKGIMAIANEFGVSKNEILAFGDDINDKEMLLSCGISVAMDNAIDEIKKMADYICESNDKDGVARYLEKCFRIGM